MLRERRALPLLELLYARLLEQTPQLGCSSRVERSGRSLVGDRSRPRPRRLPLLARRLRLPLLGDAARLLLHVVLVPLSLLRLPRRLLLRLAPPRLARDLRLAPPRRAEKPEHQVSLLVVLVGVLVLDLLELGALAPLRRLLGRRGRLLRRPSLPARTPAPPLALRDLEISPALGRSLAAAAADGSTGAVARAVTRTAALAALAALAVRARRQRRGALV
mmetsp:Transcript_49451/g.161707  ORF Transcript_49451/g.161707 Transcript_49451/m.161707 type:complete len:219 (+) Transcript_49451:557-1213(+)